MMAIRKKSGIDAVLKLRLSEEDARKLALAAAYAAVAAAEADLAAAIAASRRELELLVGLYEQETLDLPAIELCREGLVATELWERAAAKTVEKRRAEAETRRVEFEHARAQRRAVEELVARKNAEAGLEALRLEGRNLDEVARMQRHAREPEGSA
jgi:flagellar export protein FliJ